MNEIPLSQPDIGSLEIDEVISVLKSSRLSLGPRLEDFEHCLANYVDAPYAVAVSSGTAGLHICLVAMGIGAGDEVLVPSFAFVAVANAVRYVGATPVFVDILSSSLNLDPTKLEQLITPASRAMIIVHTFGHPAEIRVLLEIARKHQLKVIEDACEALGAEYQGVRVGCFGDAGVFAFYPNKQITTGEGGMVVTKSYGLARALRALRNQGRYESDDWHQHSILGYNYRLSEVNAALGCAQMARIDSILARRTAVAKEYDKLLAPGGEFLLPLLEPLGNIVSWFVYVVRIPTFLDRIDRDTIVRQMQTLGIQCGRYFAPIHSQPAYANMSQTSDLSVTERESERTIALPFFSEMQVEQVTRVVHALLHLTDQLRRAKLPVRTESRETLTGPEV